MTLGGLRMKKALFPAKTRDFVLFIAILAAWLSCPVWADLVGLWQFNEGTGTLASDSSGYGHDAELWAGPDGLENGNPTASTLPHWITRPGGGNAVEMGTRTVGVPADSQNTNWNYVYVLGQYQAALANLGLNWTISFWYNQYTNDPTINIGGGGGYQRVISCPAYEYELGVSTFAFDYFWPYYPGGSTGPFSVQIGASSSLNTWHHIALVYDGTDLKKYVDGTEDLAARQNIPNASLPDTWTAGDWLYFGRQTYPEKDFFIGALDDIAIFNEALDQTQVSAIMSGDFSGPWVTTTVEDDDPITYLYDPSFIVRYKNGQVVLDFDEKSTDGDTQFSFNWNVEGVKDDSSYYGLVNAGDWDGDTTNIEYAGFTTVGDQLTQVSGWKPIHENVVYDFTARFGGEDAVGNIVGVKIFSIDASDPNVVTLLADLNETITTNETWIDKTLQYTADADDHLDSFKVVCYIEQGSGNPRGTAFGYFDFVRIDAVDFLTCQALVDYNYGQSLLTGDFLIDCKVNNKDFVYIADKWQTGGVEPQINPGELLANPDFYADINLIPNNADSLETAPSSWTFTTNLPGAVGGIWNLDRNGLINLDLAGDYQPAGGSVGVYLDPNTMMEQIIQTPIVNGQTYYMTSLISGSGEVSTGNAYGNLISAQLEIVDDSVSPTTSTLVIDANEVAGGGLVWRNTFASYTAQPADAGQYFRVKYAFGPIQAPGGGNLREPAGYGIIGKSSVTTTPPEIWPRENLLANGDFEDFSSLPVGDTFQNGFYLDSGTNEYGWFNLVDYYDRYTINNIPGWVTSSNGNGEYGLQCMYWAPAPQPATGRTSAWFQDSIEQEVAEHTMSLGETYYVDFIGSVNASAYSTGTPWPEEDPNLVVDVYWLASGQHDLSGVEGTQWGLITSVQGTLTGPLDGGGDVPNGTWVLPKSSFTVDSSLAGNGLYVKAYCNNPAVIYCTYDEIYLGYDERPEVGPYTCYEKVNKYGGTDVADLNQDCFVDVEDAGAFANEWLNCNDPEGCF